MKPLIEFEDDDHLHRQNFRVKPHVNDPVKMKVSGVEVEIIDISARGVAFVLEQSASAKHLPFHLGFKTDRVYHIKGELEIVRQKGSELSGQFINLSEKDIASIAGLVVECQKRDIRRQKNTSD